MKKSQKKQLFNILFVVVLAVLTLVLLKNITNELTPDNLKAYFAECRIWSIFCAIACLVVFILAEAFALHLILRKFGYKPRFSSSLAYSTSDIYYSTITPSATGGQPAAVFYMMRDGVSGGTACFALVFNLLCYSASILLIGIPCLLNNLDAFAGYELWSKVLILLGLFMQTCLFFFFLASMIFHNAVRWLGKKLVGFLHALHILRKKEKWLAKVDRVVDKYRSSYESIKQYKGLMLQVFVCNVIQRAANIAISAFICISITDLSFLELFMMQALVTLGYNSFPLPGGAGAYETLSMDIYSSAFPEAIGTAIPMIMSRVITYYLSMGLSAAYTIYYHVTGSRRPPEPDEAPPVPQPDEPAPDCGCCPIPNEEISKEGN